MQAACECVCDLHGMHHVEDDLKGSLLMAMRFPEADPAPNPEAEAAEEAEEAEEVAEGAAADRPTPLPVPAPHPLPCSLHAPGRAVSGSSLWTRRLARVVPPPLAPPPRVWGGADRTLPPPAAG